MERRDREHRRQPTLFDVPESAPYQPHSGTSRKAAAEIRDELNVLQRLVLNFFRVRGDFGATDEEVQIALGMNPSTERPRRIELHRKGLIRKATTERKTRSGRSAAVWLFNGSLDREAGGMDGGSEARRKEARF